ncbi:hypothetical protein [Azospirillum sp.]|uniref:hypothetical protein n=1 Tax=Azospirillum sp. TaxID=34012 RepID=UPI002D305284|nr:hypothetical protein [Azospirillum sp.]HYD70406.1 hypothetical protein [Azospirillum sp.]
MRRRLAALAPVAALLAALAVPSAASAAEGAAALPPSIKLKALMVPVVAHGQVEKYNQLEITLELADATMLAQAQAAQPRLQDSVLTVIYKGIEEGWIVRGNIVNANAFRQKISEASQRLIGKDAVSRVLISPAGRQAAWP